MQTPIFAALLVVIYQKRIVITVAKLVVARLGSTSGASKRNADYLEVIYGKFREIYGSRTQDQILAREDPICLALLER